MIAATRPSRRPGSTAACLLALLFFACKPDPQPRSAFEGRPVRTLPAAELGEAGEVEGFAVEVVREGSGEAAERGELVRVHFIAQLEDGTELDGSHDGEPLLIRVVEDTAVIEGLAAGIIGMKVGELRRITVPPRLGYRNRANVGVPPRTNLTFLVELVEIPE